MKPTRIVVNLVGMMLFVQVILGGSAVLLAVPVMYHIAWGTLTLIVLVMATILGARSYGTKSTLFRVAIASIIDFVIQGLLGFLSFGSNVVLVVHLTNAFVLAVIVTYLISFADNAEHRPPQHGAGPEPGQVPMSPTSGEH